MFQVKPKNRPGPDGARKDWHYPTLAPPGLWLCILKHIISASAEAFRTLRPQDTSAPIFGTEMYQDIAVRCGRPTAGESDSSSDVSMRTHLSRTVSSCFATLCQLHSMRRSTSQALLLSLVVSLVLSRLDYGNATLAGLPDNQLDRLQSVMNAASRLVWSVIAWNDNARTLRVP